MQGDTQFLALFFFGHPGTDHEFDDVGRHQGHRRRAKRREHRLRLNEKLRLVPVVQSATGRGAAPLRRIEAGVERPRGVRAKYAGESCALMWLFEPVTPHRHTAPAARPMMKAPRIPTFPAAGVMATRRVYSVQSQYHGEGAALMEQLRIDEIAKRLLAKVPQAARNIQADLEENFRAVLRASLSRLDLVTRDEFDVQTKVLERTRSRLEALEARVQELEAARTARGA